MRVLLLYLSHGFEWPEQEDNQEIQPLVLFGSSVTERAVEIGTSASRLYRRMDRFEAEGMGGLFATGKAKQRKLPQSPILFETPYVLPQPRLFGPDDKGWLKALKLGEYALRQPRRPASLALQDVLFSYAEAP